VKFGSKLQLNNKLNCVSNIFPVWVSLEVFDEVNSETVLMSLCSPDKQM